MAQPCAQDEVRVGSSWEFDPRCHEADWEKLGRLRGSSQWKVVRSPGSPPKDSGSGHSREILLLSYEFLVGDVISSFFCCHHRP